MARLGIPSSSCRGVALKSLLALTATLSSTCTAAERPVEVEDMEVKADNNCLSQQAATVFMMQSNLRLTSEVLSAGRNHSDEELRGQAHPRLHAGVSSGSGHMLNEIRFEVHAQTGSIPVKDKWVLTIIEVFALGLFGIDRCYMGQVCVGVIKGCTLGGLGVLFMLDYIVIMITCLSQSPFMNALGYRADFADGEVGIAVAFVLSALSVCLFPILLTAASVLAYQAYTAVPVPVAELDKPRAAKELTDPEVASVAQDGKDSSSQVTPTEGEQLHVVLETEEEKNKKKAEERQARLDEYGGPVSFSKLLSLATPFEIFIVFLGIAGSCLQGCCQPVLFLFMGRLLDATSADVDESFLTRVNTAALGMISVGAASVCAGFASHFGLTYFGELQVAKMRPLYFRALLYRDIGWFDTHDAGSLPTDLDEDMQSYKTGFGVKLGNSISGVVQVFTALVIALVSSWQIALVMLGAMPINVLATICFSAAADHRAERQGVYSRAAKLVDEVLFAIRTVVSFGGEYRELQRYEEAVEEASWGGMRVKVKFGLGGGWIGLTFVVTLGFSFYVGMLLIVGGHQLSVGNMTTAVYAAIAAASMVGTIPSGFLELGAARQNMARFFHFIETQGDIQKHLHDERATCPPIRTLELVNVHFAYPARTDFQVLKDVTIKVEKGQRVAVVGESGSGKSTIMALFERFYDPTYGVVLVNGLNLRQFCIKSYRSQIGYVGQEPVLFATSVKNNILQGRPDATIKDVLQVSRYANLNFIDSLPEKFETYVGSGGSQFSGGQKQRIAIARALIKRPSVLFFDEATSALDNTSEKLIQGSIDNIATSSELGVTTVTIAHRLSTVRKSDVIYVMRHGELVEQGTHALLTSQSEGVYKALAMAQGLNESSGSSRRGTSEASFEAIREIREPGEGTMDEDEKEKLRVQEISDSYSVPLWRLLQFCRPEWWAFIPAMLGAAASGVIFPILGAFLIIDAVMAFVEYTEPNEMDQLRNSINRTMVLFAIMGAIRFTGVLCQQTFFGVLGESLIARCRIRLFETLLRQDIGFFDNPENTPARLVKALQVYAYRVNDLCTGIGENADFTSSIIMGVIISFLAQWRVAMLMIIAIPLIGLVGAIDAKITINLTQNEDEKVKVAAHMVTDSLSAQGARTIQASGNEEAAADLYSRTVSLQKRLAGALAGKAAAFGISKGMMFFVMGVGFWYVGYLIAQGQAEFSTSMRAFMGVVYTGLGAAFAMTSMSDATKAKIAAHDLFQILDRETLINGLEDKGETLREEGSCVGRIEFAYVNFFYPWRPDIPVLREMSFTVEAGQSVGICGPSGGGKSTLFALLQRFYDPTGGRVLIGASRARLSRLNVRWWRKQVGFVGQEPLLFEGSILDNIMYGIEDPDDLMKDRLQEVHRMAHLGFVDSQPGGWDTRVGPRGSRLSGGQKQRVAIARALIRTPAILLFDEATSALDSASEKVVSQALEEARQGRTSLTIAHRMSTIQDCDVIMVVAEGRVVELGNHSSLIHQDGVYARLQAIGAPPTAVQSSSRPVISCSPNGSVQGV